MNPPEEGVYGSPAIACLLYPCLGSLHAVQVRFESHMFVKFCLPFAHCNVDSPLAVRVDVYFRCASFLGVEHCLDNG